MKTISMMLLAIFFIASCAKDENSDKKNCDLTDPIEELPWLKEIKNSINNCSCEVSILQATYDNRTVFYTAMTDPLCNGVQSYILYNCDGNIVEAISGEETQTFLTKVTNIKSLYRCKK